MSTKEKILKAAVELFSEKGFDKTTTRDICARAECNVAAVNYHFKGKEDLGSAVIDYLFSDYEERHKGFLHAPPPRSETEWTSAIRDFIRNFISDTETDFKTSHRVKLIFNELSSPSVLFREMHSRFLRPMQERIRSLIAMGLPEDADGAEVNMWVVTLMSQCVFFRKTHPREIGFDDIDLNKPENLEKVADHIAGTLLRELKFRGGE